MPNKPRTRHTTGNGLKKLESLVSDFTQSASDLMKSNQELVASDHAKVDMMYDFLFVGKPDKVPPIPPFVSVVQNNSAYIEEFKKSINRLGWMIVAILVTAAAGFTLAVYNHVFFVSPVR